MFKLLSPQILDLPSNLREQPIVFNRESTAFHLIEMEFIYDPKIPSETEVTRHYKLLTLCILLPRFDCLNFSRGKLYASFSDSKQPAL